jgi:alpha-methylacyl-CoA racemase
MSDRSGPLAGVRVVELGGIGPVPFAAMLLADLGSDVIAVRRIGDTGVGNPVLDRGRRSIAVNLKDPRGVEVVRSLIAGSDAVIEGFRPGVAERLGFDPGELRRDNPALVFGRMTGYGQDGPLAQRAGHDIDYIALSGVLGAIGHAGDRPVPPLNLVGDFGGGGMLLAVGVLAAIINARATGRGQDVDAAMVDGAALLMAMVYGFHAAGAWTDERGANLLDTGAPFYDTYRCADGNFVAVGALEPQFFASLIDVLGVGDLVDIAQQHDRRTWPRVRTVLTETFARATRDEWAERFADTDACVAPVLGLAEAPRHAHNRSRGTFVTDAKGTVHPAPAPRFSGTPAGEPEPPAAPGSHTDVLLREIGIDESDAATLRRDGVVG